MALAHGCVSARSIYAEIKRYEKQVQKMTAHTGCFLSCYGVTFFIINVPNIISTGTSMAGFYSLALPVHRWIMPNAKPGLLAPLRMHL